MFCSVINYQCILFQQPWLKFLKTAKMTISFLQNDCKLDKLSSRRALIYFKKKKLKCSWFTRVFVSSIQQSGSVTHIFFRFFSIIGYYKILNIAPSAIEQIFVVFYIFLISLLRNKLKGLSHPFTEYVWIFHSYRLRNKNNGILFKLFKREKCPLSLGLFSFLMLLFMANIAF